MTHSEVTLNSLPVPFSFSEHILLQISTKPRETPSFQQRKLNEDQSQKEKET